MRPRPAVLRSGAADVAGRGAASGKDAAAAAARERAEVTRLSDAGDLDGARRVLEPHVRARDAQAVIDRLDVSSPRDGAVFWSGAKEAAKAHAADIGGVTLESTPGGRVVDGWDLLNNDHFPWNDGGKEFWGSLSEKYAGGASGTVHVVQSEFAAARGGGDTWRNHEVGVLADLQNEGVVTEILPPKIVPNPPRR